MKKIIGIIARALFVVSLIVASGCMMFALVMCSIGQAKSPHPIWFDILMCSSATYMVMYLLVSAIGLLPKRIGKVIIEFILDI